MAGYYDKRKRSTSFDAIIRSKPRDSDNWSPNEPVGTPGVQETYSFRTGSQAKREEFDYFSGSRAQALRTDVAVSQFDKGHTFWSTRQSFLLSHPRVDLQGRGARASRYIGPLIVGTTGDVAKYIAPTTWSQLTVNDYGNKAISRTYPTKSKADLVGMIAELMRDGLPSLIGLEAIRTRGTQLRSLGGEGLNYAFAWAPLISDLRKIVESCMDHTKILMQLQRDSGKVVRRKLSFPLTKSETIVNPDAYISRGVYKLNSWQNDDIPLPGSTFDVQVRDFRSESIWFSAAYSYALSNGKTVEQKMLKYVQEGEHLLGIGLTPDKLWNLAPWSWLADWIVDLGSAITAASAFQKDGLVLRYGYLMRSSIAARTLTATGVRLPVGIVSNTYLTTRKERFRSTPFGFGFNMATLTPYQVAILSLLGMTGTGRVAY